MVVGRNDVDWMMKASSRDNFLDIDEDFHVGKTPDRGLGQAGGGIGDSCASSRIGLPATA